MNISGSIDFAVGGLVVYVAGVLLPPPVGLAVKVMGATMVGVGLGKVVYDHTLGDYSA